MDEKIVDRNLAVALGIIVIVLLAVLLGIVLTYTSIISERNSVIAAKGSHIEAFRNAPNTDEVRKVLAKVHFQQRESIQ